MKALSIQQPWAWLIVNAPIEVRKDVENRSWWTDFRGEFLVHAGKTFDADGYDWIRHTFPEITMPAPDAFERGGIVGKATLTDCVPHSTSRYFFGPFGFMLANAEPLLFRPLRGQLGFFDVSGDDHA